MKKYCLVFASCIISVTLLSQSATRPVSSPVRPKLVVGIVVDQMRWDFLYRYYNRYKANGGFRRMLDKGFSCENTFIPYTPTVTACGHTCIYTGSVPAVHGITGNAWYDRDLKRSLYCTEDTSVRAVGINPDNRAGWQSPKNMLTTTICDELMIATNFRSKVIGIAIKDRGGILPAGHSANASYWFDTGSGNWISSTYYGLTALPSWVQQFNSRKLADEYYRRGWSTLYPLNTYTQSTEDVKAYEGQAFSGQTRFPYDLSTYVGTNYTRLPYTPYGNTLTMEMAKAALEAEQLGRDSITDFLAVSFSSPDYIGHTYGPNSIEIEDTYLRLDQDLGELFRFLDARVGAGQYTAFLSADHGVANVPGFMQEHRLPGRPMDEAPFMAEMAPLLKQQFGSDKLIVSSYNYQVHLDHNLMDSLKIDAKAVKKWIAAFLEKKEPIARAFDTDEVMLEPMPQKIREMVANGYYPKRSGDVQFILKPHWIDGGRAGTTHGLWNSYDAHIPLLWYGWGIKQGKLNREVYMTDIAPTLAAMLRIQMPGGCIGAVIPEVMSR